LLGSQEWWEGVNLIAGVREDAEFEVLLEYFLHHFTSAEQVADVATMALHTYEYPSYGEYGMHVVRRAQYIVRRAFMRNPLSWVSNGTLRGLSSKGVVIPIRSKRDVRSMARARYDGALIEDDLSNRGKWFSPSELSGAQEPTYHNKYQGLRELIWEIGPETQLGDHVRGVWESASRATEYAAHFGLEIAGVVEEPIDFAFVQAFENDEDWRGDEPLYTITLQVVDPAYPDPYPVCALPPLPPYLFRDLAIGDVRLSTEYRGQRRP